MTDERIWIILPLPNRALSPNARVRPFMRRSAARKARRIVAEAIDAQDIEGLPWGKCRVTVKMYHKRKRRRDVDNMVAMLKSTYDGIVDAGVVGDDTPELMVREWPEMLHDKNAPRMEITITREEGETQQ